MLAALGFAADCGPPLPAVNRGYSPVVSHRLLIAVASFVKDGF